MSHVLNVYSVHSILENVLNVRLCALGLLGMVRPFTFAVLLSAFRWIVFANLHAKMLTGMYIVINIHG